MKPSVGQITFHGRGAFRGDRTVAPREAVVYQHRTIRGRGMRVEARCLIGWRSADFDVDQAHIARLICAWNTSLRHQVGPFVRGFYKSAPRCGSRMLLLTDLASVSSCYLAKIMCLSTVLMDSLSSQPRTAVPALSYPMS